MSTWLDRAERCPLRFSQVREDPRLDLELIDALPAGASAIMIASGGDTAALLRSRSRLRRLHLVDANPAQLALTKLKLELQRSDMTRDRALSILGHREMDPIERSREIQRLLGALKIDPAILGPSEMVGALGPDQIGRYELLFAELRRQLHQSENGPELRRWLNETLPGKAARMTQPDSNLGRAIDRAFDDVMALKNLIRLFGEDATQNPRLTFASHFADQTRHSLRRFAPAENPFLWQIFAGRFFDDALYDWMNYAVSKQTDATPGMEICYHQGMMREVLDDLTPGAFDFVHLSNILDWLTPEEATRTLAAAARILRPGGAAIIRQLNSSLDIRNLPGELAWDAAQSASLLERDRSFFYRALHVGRKARK
ncbi:MAG: S-adenosylmethionine-diacylglycerol 3-amino-3-carboxypropyl transferase [Paracoccaceae bacterium]|jgi:S-adenosylmethionine-diacylglycerol 3-amino-3-carboxypropyl transferase